MNDSLGAKSIDLVYFNAGGGHRAAATALETVIREQGRPWEVRLVNFMHVLDPKDIFLKTTGMNWEDIYNSRLARGWSVGLAQELKLLQALIRLSNKSMAKKLAAPVAQDQARPGGFGDPELQSHDVRRAGSRPAAGALRDDSHRLCGLPAALLDGTPTPDASPPGAALHLRYAQGGGPGARHGLCGRTDCTRPRE